MGLSQSETDLVFKGMLETSDANMIKLFDVTVRQYQERHGLSRADAIRRVARNHQALHREFVTASHNLRGRDSQKAIRHWWGKVASR